MSGQYWVRSSDAVECTGPAVGWTLVFSPFGVSPSRAADYGVSITRIERLPGGADLLITGTIICPADAMYNVFASVEQSRGPSHAYATGLSVGTCTGEPQAFLELTDSASNTGSGFKRGRATLTTGGFAQVCVEYDPYGYGWVSSRTSALPVPPLAPTTTCTSLLPSLHPAVALGHRRTVIGFSLLRVRSVRWSAPSSRRTSQAPQVASPKHRQLLRGADRGVAKSGGAPEVGPCRARLVKEIVAVPGRVEDDAIDS